MIYKHYIIEINEKDEYKGTTIIAYTTSLQEATKLDFILKTFFSLNKHNKNYKIGYTQLLDK